jgi:hypothetical protein
MSETFTIIDMEWGARLLIEDGAVLDDESIRTKTKSLLDRLRKNNKKRILIDATNNISYKSVMNLYYEAEQFQKIGGFGFRVAVIAPHRFNTDNTNFFETLGYNRGFTVKYFKDNDEALKWLLL